jgi:serine/threonine protein kinase
MERLGNYIVGDTLGEGGFSTVKLGVHQTTGQRVALKMLKKKQMEDRLIAAAEREINVMTKVMDHPNVIRFYDFDLHAEYSSGNSRQEIILVVLELASGGELFDYLSYSGQFDELIARSYFHQLISGLQYCHSKGVTHRDLKPENLLLDEHMVMKIADFGLGTFGRSSMKTECGTQAYMAPEMFAGKGYEGVKTDIWAAGIILFIMVAGFPPFTMPSMQDWWFNKLASKKAHLFWQAHCRNAKFSDAFKDLIEKILCVDPSSRATISDIAAHPWFLGHRINEDQLEDELQKRKRRVDEAKARERMEQKLKNSGVDGNADGNEFAQDDIRGETERDADDLPELVPQFKYKAAKAQIGEPDADEVPDEKSAEGEAAVPVYDRSQKVACYTTFMTALSPDDVMSRLASALAGFHGKIDINKRGYSIKNVVHAGSDLVTINTSVHIDAETKQTLVVCKRHKGDVLQFRSIFFKLRTLLHDVIED